MSYLYQALAQRVGIRAIASRLSFLPGNSLEYRSGILGVSSTRRRYQYVSSALS